jgi:hypothetical protein
MATTITMVDAVSLLISKSPQMIACTAHAPILTARCSTYLLQSPSRVHTTHFGEHIAR